MNILLRLTFLTFTLGLGLTSQLQAAKSKQSKQKPFFHRYKKNGFSIKLREMTPQESKKRLSHPFEPRKGSDSIIPLEVKITNHSSRGVNFSKDELNLKLVSRNKVIASVRRQLGPIRELIICLLCLLIIMLIAFILMFIFPWAGITFYMLMNIVALPYCQPIIKRQMNIRKVCINVTCPYIRFDYLNYIARKKTLTQVIYVKRKDLPSLQG